MPRWSWLLVVPVVIAVAYLALLFVVQRSMLFPVPLETPPNPASRAEIVRVRTGDLDAYGLYLAPRAAPGRTPVIMFFHGNGELADYWIEDFDVPRAWGCGVLLVEYPGYGAAAGSPSERAIMASAHALFDWAAKDPRLDPARIVAYGRSLGGGAAARLAGDRPVAAMILESAFTSVADFAARFLAPSFLIRDPFDSRAALKSYHGPLLVIHGRQDTIVPVAHGRELASLVPGAELREIDCGHNDCPRQWDAIAAFLKTARVLLTEEKK